MRNQAEQIMKSFEDAFHTKSSVDTLEQQLEEAEGNVYTLRDALLAATKDLLSPKRRLGIGSANKLDQSQIDTLRQMRQVRLRDIIYRCLAGIRASGVGEEVTKVAVAEVCKMIVRFEMRAEEDVGAAHRGEQWHKLKELVSEMGGDEMIDDLAHGTEPGECSNRTKPEGRGTKQVIEQAITASGGIATTKQIFTWVENNLELLDPDDRKMKLNTQTSKKSAPEKEFPVWKVTIPGSLTKNFERSKMPCMEGQYGWRIPRAAAAALADEAGEGEAEDEAEGENWFEAGARRKKPRLEAPAVAEEEGEDAADGNDEAPQEEAVADGGEGEGHDAA